MISLPLFRLAPFSPQNQQEGGESRRTGGSAGANGAARGTTPSSGEGRSEARSAPFSSANGNAGSGTSRGGTAGAGAAPGASPGVRRRPSATASAPAPAAAAGGGGGSGRAFTPEQERIAKQVCTRLRVSAYTEVYGSMADSCGHGRNRSVSVGRIWIPNVLVFRYCSAR